MLSLFGFRHRSRHCRCRCCYCTAVFIIIQTRLVGGSTISLDRYHHSKFLIQYLTIQMIGPNKNEWTNRNETIFRCVFFFHNSFSFFRLFLRVLPQLFVLWFSFSLHIVIITFSFCLVYHPISSKLIWATRKKRRSREKRHQNKNQYQTRAPNEPR